jgi:putative endopeptidase
MRRQLFAFLFAALPLAAAMAAAQTAAGPPPSASGVDRAALDRSQNPCTDFYTFACGGWDAANPIPPDRQRWGRFDELQERNFTILRQVLETPGGTGDEKKARDYYAACMNRRTIDAQGLAPLQPDLTRIASLESLEQLPGVLAALQTEGIDALFNFGAATDPHDATREMADVDQGGLELPNRDYYTRTDDASVKLRGQYVAHMQRMLEFLGDAPDQAAAGARAAMAFETALANASLGPVDRRNPAATDHAMALSDLQALTPHFDWTAYRTAAGAPAFDRVNVSVPDFFRAVDRLIASTPIADLRAYLRWWTITESSAMLPTAIDQADFDFFGRTLGGQQAELPRWRRCVSVTDRQLGEALGQAFVERAFGPKSKADMLAMVQGIKDAMRRDIDAATWMSDETKQAARAKLAAVVDRIGYPDRWRSYAAVTVAADTALANRRQAMAFAWRRDVAKIGRPVDRTEWGMTPPTVNAYYSADRNNINFPAGILQPPFYEAGRDAAVNYGGAGAVIGHELTHGFDDQGRQYDGQGNLRDWWTAADASAFEQRASCIADEYDAFPTAGDTHVNGRLTLGENTADNGGLRLALMAYLAGPGADAHGAIDGFTPGQRFFLGWAQVWCENRRPEYDKLQALTNPHSPGRYRVNGVVSNMPEFQQAFSCPASAPMVRQNACRVW